jgi:hypothetical protein
LLSSFDVGNCFRSFNVSHCKKKYRQDIVISLPDRVINIKVDEFEHGIENPFYNFRGNKMIGLVLVVISNNIFI